MVDIPIIMTENGIGTNDDEQRIRYLTGALAGLANVIDDGIDVRGYFQWSLLDNFEWTFGYRPKFGIVAVDRETFARTPKPSAALVRRGDAKVHRASASPVTTSTPRRLLPLGRVTA